MEWAKEGKMVDWQRSCRREGTWSYLAGGCGEDLLLVGAKQTDEQGLREALRQRGGVRLRGYDPFDGEAVGPWLRFPNVSEG